MTRVILVFGLGLLVMLALYVLAIRGLRRTTARIAELPSHPSFDMAELNSMLADGLITPAEFERLKELIIAQRNRVIPMGQGKEHGFEVLPPTAKPLDPFE